ncbi:helix-turn-helix transcriptional regulator [Demequina sp. NBRC 110057]|uniref:helix-turn-helix transcriptional regulator n=1 Tax=Demequina sp. NBRC 110057 TaxID=1570346 RepID=UPI0009FF3A4F|nr:helix-turn-helix transcriptional regulator [Demequina sp. NBRC 110057]
MSARNADEVKAFLSSRRARVTPEEAGLPAYGGRRRVKGLRREEVAMLAGVSVDYYVRLERGNLAGASDSVLDSLATALRLDEAEREHLFDLARAAGPSRPSGRRADASVPWSVRAILDGMHGVPAWVRNGRHDIIAANLLGRALYSPVFDGSAERPVNTTKFTFLDPAARSFWRDYEQVAHDGVAMLQMEAGRHPHDKRLITLVGELSTRSEEFRRHWASRDVTLHRSGLKRLHHPVAGDLDLTYESLPLASTPGLTLNVYTAPPGSPTADALAILGSWAATQREDFLALDASVLGESIQAG